MTDPVIRIEEPGMDSQGELGALLLDVLGPVLQKEQDQIRAAGLEAKDVEDELMAADDFYLSSADLMRCVCFARADDDNLIGAVVVNPFTSEISHLVVREEYRRQGIGRELLKQGIHELQRRGCSHVKMDMPLCVDTEAAQAFLKAQGFLKAQTTLRMGKTLSENAD